MKLCHEQLHGKRFGTTWERKVREKQSANKYLSSVSLLTLLMLFSFTRSFGIPKWNFNPWRSLPMVGREREKMEAKNTVQINSRLFHTCPKLSMDQRNTSKTVSIHRKSKREYRNDCNCFFCVAFFWVVVESLTSTQT